MRGVKLALLGGLALLAFAIFLTLLRSPLSVAASNRVPGHEGPIATTTHSARYCQAHETLPGGVTAIRVALDASAGPRVNLAAYSAGHVITSGSRGSIWIGSSATIPVRPLPRTVSDVTVCVSFRLHDETIFVIGKSSTKALAAHAGQHALSGRIGVEYLRPGARSWLSLAVQVARHMGLGRAAAGTWVALAALALLAAIAALASVLVVRELG
jgi:hypothetical protein